MITLADISKTYENEPLLTDITFEVKAGETVCLLGASGSGKSTLLRMIAGLEQPQSGDILWQGQSILQVPAHQRQFGLMFQDYALFPHLNVFENVAFGLKIQHWSAGDIQARVAEVLELVHLTRFVKRSIGQLSGGEQQRVALARALAPQPRLLMLDEPLGALDRSLKESLLSELREILHLAGIPAIYVTHDQREAFAVADRLILLHNGKIQQAGSPQELVLQPASAWVARFLGLGNLLSATVASPGVARSEWGNLLFKCEHAHRPGETVQLLIRPSASLMKGEINLTGRVADVLFDGQDYVVTLAGGLVFRLSEPLAVGSEARIFTASAQCLGADDEVDGA